MIRWRRVAVACLVAVVATVGTAAPARAAALPPPQNVTASALSASVRVGWAAVSGANRYTVLRATASEGPYATIGIATIRSYLDKAVTPGVRYYYVVRAVNGTTTSGDSDWATATVPIAPLSRVAHTAHRDRVELSWVAPPGAHSYDVSRAGADGNSSRIIGYTDATSFTDTTVADGTGYTYWVRVYGASATAQSQPLKVFTGAPTSTVVTTSPEPSETGQYVRLAAMVSIVGGGKPNFGDVHFAVNGNRIPGTDSVRWDGRGIAERQWDGSGGGIVTADYQGDASSGLGSSGSPPYRHRVVNAVEPPPAFDTAVLHEYGVDSRPRASAVADVTGDGRQDVLMTTLNGGRDRDTDFLLWVFAQRSDGTLAEPTTLGTSGGPAASSMRIAVGDVDADGDTDVAVTSPAGVDLFRQDRGRLLAAVTIPVEGGANSMHDGDVHLTDMDGDRRADLVVAGLSRVVVLRSNADATFGPAVLVATGARHQIEIGDVTGDGRLDVVSQEGIRMLVVDAQTATGGFTEVWREPDPAGSYESVRAIAVADATGDGRADLAVVAGGNVPSSWLHVYAQGSTGGFTPPVTYPTWHIPETITLSDLDGDGRRDAIMYHGGWVTFSVMRQRSDGRLGSDYFSSVPSYATHDRRAMSVGDVTGDRLPDVVIADPERGLFVVPRL